MFSNRYTLEHFFTCFSDEQLRAVREIQIDYNLHVSMLFRNGVHPELRSVFKRLTNFKRIFMSPGITTGYGSKSYRAKFSLEGAADVLAEVADVPTDGRLGIDMLVIDLSDRSKKIEDASPALRL